MKCRICGNSDRNKLFKAREMMFGTREAFTYCECASCGCVQITEIPDDLARFYAGDYYSFKPVIRNGIATSLCKRIMYRSAVFRRGRLGRFLNSFYGNTYLEQLGVLGPTPDTAILDIGCGSGEFLHSLREIGFTRLLGQDPHLTSDIVYTNGLRLTCCDISSLNESYDIVTMHHSLEHMDQPLTALCNAHAVLRNGGFCCVTTPLAGSLVWRMYQANWVQLDAPRHLHVLSKVSMLRLAQEAGFTIWKTIYNSSAFQFWGSEQYGMDIPLTDRRSLWCNKRHSLFTHTQIKDYALASRYLNAIGDGDQATIFLRKE